MLRCFQIQERQFSAANSSLKQAIKRLAPHCMRAFIIVQMVLMGVVAGRRLRNPPRPDDVWVLLHRLQMRYEG